MTIRLTRAKVRFSWASLVAVGLVAGTLVGCAASEPPATGAPPPTSSAACSSPNWVTSWGAAPSDASFPTDATFGPLPQHYENQSVRNVITPHLASDGEVRLHLTNRFNTAPVTFERVTIGRSAAGGAADAPVAVQFGGKPSVTVAAGQDVVSDPVKLTFDAFVPLAVSIYLRESGPLTKHWNSNATTFLTAVDGGDQTGASSGAAFTQKVQSWIGVRALDVQAGLQTRAIVTFGDSITDGWVGASSTQTRLDVTVADKHVRYPDFLQHRLDSADIPISVVNMGISGNQILAGVGPSGPSALDRFDSDVPTVAGARGVIIFEGINDLGLSRASAADIIVGLEQLVAQAKAAKLRVWLATITPASDSTMHGVGAAPNSEEDRQVVNEWIRTKAAVDGVFDFDAAVRDPANPAVLSTRYGSPDRLHLNPTGYEKLAATVDLKAIATTSC